MRGTWPWAGMVVVGLGTGFCWAPCYGSDGVTPQQDVGRLQVLTLCGTRESLREPSSPRFQGERKVCVWRSAWQLREGSVQVAELREGVSGRGIGLGGTLQTLALYLLPNLAKGRSQPPPSGAARVSCLRKQDPAARGLHSGSSGRRPSPTPGAASAERGGDGVSVRV